MQMCCRSCYIFESCCSFLPVHQLPFGFFITPTGGISFLRHVLGWVGFLSMRHICMHFKWLGYQFWHITWQLKKVYVFIQTNTPNWHASLSVGYFLSLSLSLFLIQTMSVVFQCVYVWVTFFCVIIKKADFKFIASLKLNTQRHECASFAFTFPLYSCIRWNIQDTALTFSALVFVVSLSV